MNKNDTLKILKEFYNSTNINNSWYIKDGWQDQDDFCSFAGISCDVNGNFGIYLESNGLKGKIPDSFSEIECILEINLSKNQIENLPSLTNMKNLTYLSISDNLIESIENLACIENLIFLNISSNRLTSIPNFNNILENLDISYNNISNITSPLPSTLIKLDISHNDLIINSNNSELLSSLKNLTHLVLNDLQIKDFTFLSELVSLETLKMNRLDLDDFPASLYDCKELKELNARNNRIKSITNKFSELKNLSYLDLSNNIIESIQVNVSLGSINTLLLSNNLIRSDSLRTLTQYFQSLKSLFISNNLITTINPDICNSNISLVILDLSFNNITSLEGFDCVPNLKYLEYLNLENNSISELPSGMKELTNLRNLYISYNSINSTKFLPSSITVLRADNNQIYNTTEVTSYFGERGYPFSYVDLRLQYF